MDDIDDKGKLKTTSVNSGCLIVLQFMTLSSFMDIWHWLQWSIGGQIANIAHSIIGQLIIWY